MMPSRTARWLATLEMVTLMDEVQMWRIPCLNPSTCDEHRLRDKPFAFSLREPSVILAGVTLNGEWIDD